MAQQDISIAAIIDYQDDGVPFLGLEISTTMTRTMVYVGNVRAGKALAAGIDKAADELAKIPRKTILHTDMKGVNPDAFRKTK